MISAQERAEGAAELPVLTSKAPHHRALSLVAVALPKAHPSTACLDMSCPYPFPKPRNTCSGLGLFLLPSSRAGAGAGQRVGAERCPGLARLSDRAPVPCQSTPGNRVPGALPALLSPQLQLQPGPSPAPTQKSKSCSWSFPSLSSV